MPTRIPVERTADRREGWLRVLMFGWEFPPHQAGGLATATLGLVQGLLRNDVEVTLVVPFDSSAAPLDGLRILGRRRKTRLRRVRVPSPLVPYADEPGYRQAVIRDTADDRPFSPYGANLFAEVERLAGIAGRIARSESHDVIDCHDWMTYAAGIRARAVSGRPLIVHLHATERDRSGDGANPEIVRREREGLLAADRVICNSRWMRRQIVESYGVYPDRIDVIPWGIADRDSLTVPGAEGPFPKDEPVVLFLGRVTRQKGPDFFVEVAGRVAHFVPQARFVVAGTGDLLPRVIERAIELGLEDRFHVAGGLQGAEVDRAFRMASVCLMPSVSEPFGLVALESLRNGTPCLVPRESGAAEVVRHALRSDFWDVERMADQVVAVLRHSELRRELSERGRAEVAEERFGLDEPARRTASTYRRARKERL